MVIKDMALLALLAKICQTSDKVAISYIANIYKSSQSFSIARTSEIDNMN